MCRKQIVVRMRGIRFQKTIHETCVLFNLSTPYCLFSQSTFIYLLMSLYLASSNASDSYRKRRARMPVFFKSALPNLCYILWRLPWFEVSVLFWHGRLCLKIRFKIKSSTIIRNWNLIFDIAMPLINSQLWLLMKPQLKNFHLKINSADFLTLFSLLQVSSFSHLSALSYRPGNSCFVITRGDVT